MAKTPEVYVRGTTYYARHVDANGKPKRTSLEVRVGVPNAAALIQEALAALLSGARKSEGKAVGMTLGEGYLRAYREYWQHQSDPSIPGRWEEVKAYFGEDTPLASVTGSQVSEFKSHLLTKGNSAKTVNRKLSVISRILHLAAHEWTDDDHKPLLDRLPAMKRMKEKRGRIRWLTDAEEATMLAFMRAGAGGAQRPSGGSWVDGVFVPVTGPLVPRSGSEDFADAIAVLIDTGMRLGELLRAKDRDLTFGAEPSIYVPESKGDAQRTIPLSERAALIFSRRLRRDREADEKERGTSKPFGMLTVDRCDTLWAHAREAMGLARDEEFVIHALRHTFAKRIVDGDVDIRVLSYLMGHRRLETTMIYAHVSNRAARRAMKQAEAVRAGVLESAPMLTAVREVATER